MASPNIRIRGKSSWYYLGGLINVEYYRNDKKFLLGYLSLSGLIMECLGLYGIYESGIIRLVLIIQQIALFVFMISWHFIEVLLFNIKSWLSMSRTRLSISSILLNQNVWIYRSEEENTIKDKMN